jgi:hypothetical protein
MLASFLLSIIEGNVHLDNQMGDLRNRDRLQQSNNGAQINKLESY